MVVIETRIVALVESYTETTAPWPQPELDVPKIIVICLSVIERTGFHWQIRICPGARLDEK